MEHPFLIRTKASENLDRALQQYMKIEKSTSDPPCGLKFREENTLVILGSGAAIPRDPAGLNNIILHIETVECLLTDRTRYFTVIQLITDTKL